MLTPETFDRNEGVILTPYEFSDEQIAQATEGLPEWLPVEYSNFSKLLATSRLQGLHYIPRSIPLKNCTLSALDIDVFKKSIRR